MLLWLFYLVCSALCTSEFASTKDLYRELLSTETYTFVYIYSVGCQWCQKLTPHYEQLRQLFQEDERSLVRFFMIDGKKSRNLVKDFNIDSYPQLLLFEPRRHRSDDRVVLPSDLLLGVYHGTRKVRDMASYLGEATGHFPQWPDNRERLREVSGPQSFLELYERVNEYWQGNLELFEMNDTNSRPSSSTSGGHVILLSFSSPWMCERYKELFYGDLPYSLLSQLSAEYESSVDFFGVDISLEVVAPLTNLFRISNSPTIVLLLQHDTLDSKLVVLDLLRHDRQTWQNENDVLSQLLNASVQYDLGRLETLARDFHSIYVYHSLREMQWQIQTEVDSSIGESGDTENTALLFNRIRDM